MVSYMILVRSLITQSANTITWETEGSLYARGIIVKPKGRIGVDINSRYKN